MSNIKKAAIAVVGAVSLMLPLSAVVHAESDVNNLDINQDVQFSDLECNVIDVEIQTQTTDGCDLGIDKQVSVNGGTYAEADTSADAAQAQVGDTVTWQVTVTNTSDGELTPTGNLTVSDVLPSGVTYVGSTASAGSYDSTTGDWTFSLDGNLPATLTITSTASATGLYENIATLSAYDPCLDGCNGAGVYADSNPDNNSNDAWVDPSAKPQVLADSTLTNTGSGTSASFLAGGLIVATVGVLAAGRFGKKTSRT